LPVDNTKRAVIYTRISLDRSGEGAPIERQLESCQGLAAARGWDVVAHKTDTQSASNPRKIRPGWQAVIEMIENDEVEVVISHQLDRMSRSLRDTIDLFEIAKEKDVWFVTSQGDLDLSNEAGRMMATMLTAVAQFEVERKGTRQRDAYRKSAQDGEFWKGGFRAFGFNDDGTHREDEAEAIRTAVDDVLNGTSLNEIARRWQAAGFRTGRASTPRWRLQSVRTVLLNPKNAGLRRYKDEFTSKGNWEPIISEAKLVQVKAFLKDPARRVGGNPGGRTPQNLLSGIAKCSVCDEVVRSGSARGTKVYTCKRGCVATEREPADVFALESMALVVRGLGAPSAGDSKAASSAGVSPQFIFDERERLNKNRESLVRALGSGAITDDEFHLGVTAIREQLDALDDTVTEAVSVLGTIAQGGKEFAEILLSGTLRAKREGLRAMLGEDGSILFRPKGRGRRNVPIEDQVRLWVPFGGELVAGHLFDR